MCEIDAIILASGNSSRMGQNKLLRFLDEERNVTVLDALLSEIPYQLFRAVLVVISDTRVQKLAEKYPVQIIFNERSQEGKSQAIITGVEQSKSVDGIMFFVADQPLLTKSTITTIVQQFNASPMNIVVPIAAGNRQNPVCFPIELKPYLLDLRAEQGGKSVIERFPDRVITVACDDLQEFCDVDDDQAFHKVKSVYGSYK